MSPIQTINISTSAIFRAILIVLGLFFLYLIRDILVIVFLSIIIAAAINGPVNWLQKNKVPRLLGVIFIYLIIFLILGLIISLVFPTLAGQMKQLASNFPEFLDKIGGSVQEWWGKYQLDSNLRSLLNAASGRLSQATSNVFTTVVNVFGGIFSALIILVISFYLTVQEKGVKSFLASLIPHEHQAYFSNLVERIEIKIGGWLRGELLLMFIIGLLTFIGLKILGVNYALTLALLAGLLEIIPFIGPIVAAIPAVFIAFFQSPLLALLVIILYVVIQELENYLIVPQVMRKALGLNPIVIIIAILVGAKLAGILGIVLAVPLTGIIAEFFKDIKK